MTYDLINYNQFKISDNKPDETPCIMLYKL